MHHRLRAARDARRLEVARHLGADYTINVEEEDLVTRVREITRGVDVVLDMALGAPATVLPAIELLRTRGTLVVVPTQGALPSFPIHALPRKGLTVKGANDTNCYRSIWRST